jgi:hypothetical protein
MADAFDDARRDFLLGLNGKIHQWEVSITLPYAAAYGTAYRNYLAKLEEAKKKAQANLEFFGLVASILSGALIMAVFGSAFWSAMGGLALNYVSQHLAQTFRVVGWVTKNKPLMFAIGEAFEKAGEAIKEDGKKAIIAMAATNPGMILTSLISISAASWPSRRSWLKAP